MERLLENARDMPDNVRPMFDALRGGGTSVIATVIGFFVFLCIAVVFSTLGGLIGVGLGHAAHPRLERTRRPDHG